MRQQVTICMPQGGVAAAAVDSLGARPDLQVVDFDNYVKIVAAGSIQLELDDIGDRLGRALSMAEFLGSVSSFTGRVVMYERTFTICWSLPGILPDDH
ncbi:MAG TPA: MmoB/DmpM family protein [Sporichthyaceae bacterium]|nr:MmoB/DmpM family protein [Sporichthyaceae bacterium]